KMEDVIFAGTDSRPARNMAEVSVLLDNSKRTAPGPHNNTDEIEVVRKIARDQGSAYRINGKGVRARDVQLLYADILSGANSPYLVSQGKITNMIQAKPLERRMFLEEAAGISGLYARRHEAELRLRATETNLGRLDDLLGGMETRLADLKKQARQAAKYRNLSAQIRQLEVMIAALEWRASHDKLREVERAFGVAESAVAEHLTVVTQLTRTQNTQAADLPDLRQKDAETAASLQAQKIALQRLEDEAQRIDAQLSENENQLAQIGIDRMHERETLAENEKILTQLERENEKLSARQETDTGDLTLREAEKTRLQEIVNEQDAACTALMEQAAQTRAQKESLESRIAQDQKRRESLELRHADIAAHLTEQKARAPAENPVETLRAGIAASETRIETLRKGIEEKETALQEARSKAETAREALREAENNKIKKENEINALESVIKLFSEGLFRPILDDIHTEDGFEIALSRALGDTLTASTDPDAPIVWREAPAGAIPDLPSGLQSLSRHVKAPKALGRALSQIGFIAEEQDAPKYVDTLHPGQSIVARSGAYWRWDGLHIKADAPDRHAVQIQQKNRLEELQKQIPALEKAIEAATEERDQTQTKREKTENSLTALRPEHSAAEAALRADRAALSDALEGQAATLAEQAKQEETLRLLSTELQDLNSEISKNNSALKNFDDKLIEKKQTEISTRKAALSTAREELQEALTAFDMARQEQSRRKARLQAIGDERVNLQNRCIRAREHLKTLDARESEIKEKTESLRARPAAIRAETEALLSKITVKEREKNALADKIAGIEGELSETTRALKEAESQLASAREDRARAQAMTEERQRHLREIKTHVEEHFGMAPEDLHAEAALDPDNLPALEDLKSRKESDIRARDAIGPVNLRADTEAEDLETELGGILNERADLLAAIQELRGGINKLNKEARERLNAAFDRVNAHFRDMFTRLFGGGKAHLALIESDDPLEAGLEIYAQPPGKALQSLSLLSGGEQTLTAIALIFAMFLTNPAPICVLDEVDAPLDDANVDRVCDLLEEFAERGETRFLIITHHRLTMARMDRLYGVTMTEKGVSQLVSVDLNQQLDFLEAAA
ncbi:MAG: chromosome segregation protein SMC, partial [Alphaproteobacteria bacterium]|nr:chromosome segregation protein SMC [Alphaproteobacteria bacterium]